MKTPKEIQHEMFQLIKKQQSKKLHAASYNLGLYDAVKLINEGRQEELLEMLILRKKKVS